jgi:hypothetical protein
VRSGVTPRAEFPGDELALINYRRGYEYYKRNLADMQKYLELWARLEYNAPPERFLEFEKTGQ